MKRILTVQDISCVGKCSLTVALPVISALGVETVVLPTAVLSMHTAFPEFTFRDLTEDMESIAGCMERQGMTFDAIYTGYLGSIRQMEIVTGIIERFRGPETKVIVDPAMADFGKLYSGFSTDFVCEMAALCKQADVILPNLTEACLLTGLPYRETPDEAFIRELLLRLTEGGTPYAALTGVVLRPEEMGVLSYDAVQKRFFSYGKPQVKQLFHGTGDVFASAFSGAWTSGLSKESALRLAVDVTHLSISKTLEDADHRWYGVNFEEVLPTISSMLSAYRAKENGGK